MTAIVFSVIIPLLTAIAGWFVGAKKRNNDFIGQLQSSIDLLSEKYTKTLNEFVIVKEQNAELLIGQSEMAGQIKTLRKENAALKREVEDLTAQLQDVKIITRQAK